MWHQSYDGLTEVEDLLLMAVARPEREVVTGCILACGTENSFETRCLCLKGGPEAAEIHRL